MKLILDASIAVKWYVDEPSHDLAQSWLDSEIIWTAPDLLFAEVAHALRRQERHGKISSEHTSLACEQLARLIPQTVPSTDLVMDAVRLSQELDHSVYDCFYLAQSRNEEIAILTADEKFAAKVAIFDFSTNIIVLGDGDPADFQAG